MALKVAIVGRPNVGKSTLFNRLVGRRLALVDDTPGVTRDRREGQGTIAGLDFTVIDTAGLEDASDDSLSSRMQAQTGRAIDDADVVLLLIDARAGITALDRHFAAWLRGFDKPVILCANKAEGTAGRAGSYEAFELGLGEPVGISAEHGEGMGDLFDALLPFAGDERPPADETFDAEAPISLAIVGRPNVGKSTLVNRLLGDDRLLTGPEAGITRDSITIDWAWHGRKLRLVDTAGLRRRAKTEDKLDLLSASDTLRAIRFAQVVILMVDAETMLEKQDLVIARLVADEGRALVVAASKWDLIEDKPAAAEKLSDRLQTSLPQLAGISAIPVSGQTGAGLERLLEAVFTTYETWNRRVPTPALNRWLAHVQERHPPPLVDGKRLRLRYITQANTRPPTFALFASKPGDLPEAYRRYLVNLMREEFDLAGVPIRMMLRKGANPYAGKAD